MLRTERLSKTFFTDGDEHRVLDDVDLEIGIGAVGGPSGAGKSTLARCVNLLERPTSGGVHIAGVDVTGMRSGRLDQDLANGAAGAGEGPRETARFRLVNEDGR